MTAPRTVAILPLEVGGLDLIGKAAVLKTAGRKPLGVRVPRPPPTAFSVERIRRNTHGEVPEWLKGAAC